ncbi:hypothetical protein WME87_47215 [Sorangium sp. So ce1389]
MILGYTLKLERIAREIEGALNRPAVADGLIERGRELDGGTVAKRAIHADRAVDVLGDRRRLWLRVARVQHDDADAILQDREERGQRLLVDRSPAAVLVVEDELLVRRPVGAEVNDVGLHVEQRLLEVVRADRPARHERHRFSIPR